MSEKESTIKRGIDIESNPDEQASGNSYFLGIGINQYKAFPKLYNAVKDVEDLLEVLQARYKIDRAYLVLDKQATREGIITQLDQLVKTVQTNDKLLIYYSGHGHLDKDINKGYWIPTDAEKDNTVKYIRNSTIKEYIEVIKAKHILLISDSCFSGSLFMEGSMRSVAAMEELDQRISRWAFCSGRHDEAVFDGTPGTNSPFAASIIEVLQTNTHKNLNIGKVVNQVIESTRANYEQLPEGNPMFGVGHRGGQYIFQLQNVLTEVEAIIPTKKAKKPRPKVITVSNLEKQSLLKGILQWMLHYFGFIVIVFFIIAALALLTPESSLFNNLIRTSIFWFFPAPLVASYLSKLPAQNQRILFWMATTVFYLALLIWTFQVEFIHNKIGAFALFVIIGLLIYYFSLKAILRKQQP